MLRGVRYHRSTPGFRTRAITLVTTLLDPEVYSVPDLAELYRRRWQVETARAPLKTTMPRDVWHGQTVPGVWNELTILAIVSNLVRLVRCPSATRPHSRGERSRGLEALRGRGAPRTRTP